MFNIIQNTIIVTLLIPYKWPDPGCNMWEKIQFNFHYNKLFIGLTLFTSLLEHYH